MKRNAYLAKEQEKFRQIEAAVRQTYRQYMVDTLVLTLNDPQVMGKDVFGAARLEKLLPAWERTYDLYFDAMTKLPEADYKREKMDAALRAILKKKFVPFLQRYDYLPEIRYRKERR